MTLRAWCFILCGWTAACTTPNTEPTAGSESHFLSACDDACGSSFSCRCGACTTSCALDSECRKFNATAVCVAASSSDAGPSCEAAQTAAHCDVPCAVSADCASVGSGYFCSRNYCRVDPLAMPSEPEAGFGLLCQQSTVTCATATNPPNLVGNYSGQTTVLLSSNALWAVRDVSTFSAQITDQTNGTVTGTVTLPSVVANIQSSTIRGEAPLFAMYVSTFVDQNGCNLETRNVLSGTLDTSANPAMISGGVALRFTGNYSGAGCTADQTDNYPDTGANFQVTATRTQ